MFTSIKIDFYDVPAMVKIMDNYHSTKIMLFGKNDDGEMTTTSIFKDKIVVVTYQNNHWVRINTLYRDSSIEETFDGKWN